MKRLAIFDFDGTLFDSIHDVLICFNKALAIHDFPPLTREELIPCLGGNIGEIVALVLNENNTPKNVEEVKRTYLDLYYSSDKELTVPFPKAHGLLRKLQDDGVILAINSNRLSGCPIHWSILSADSSATLILSWLKGIISLTRQSLIRAAFKKL